MKISKSKRQLAQLLIEAGVKQFPEDANWAAQCSKDNCVSFYGGERPRHNRGELVHYGDYYGKQHDVKLTTLITNWHQTVLTRAEFDQIVAESAEKIKPDADGWIESVTAPTLDQLLQDYRNASDFAAAKQAEADDAAKMRDERWKAAQARACELGVRISVGLVVDAEMRESEPVITDWRDLRVGDIVIITSVFGGGGNLGYEKIIGNEAVIMVVGDPDCQGLAVDFLGRALYIDGYRFVRRLQQRGIE